jgi:formate dehydrogenase
VAEHAVMQILGLVRNYIPSYDWIIKKGWNIADFVKRAMIWRAWMLAW